MNQIHSHIKNLKDENLRLENEIKRLNFIIESFVSELKIKEISDIQDILTKKIKTANRKKINKKRRR